MLQIIYILSFVWTILTGPCSNSLVDAFPTAKAGVQIAYHIGDIVEHAYTNEAPAHPNPYPLYPAPPPVNLQQFTHPMVQNAGQEVPSSGLSSTTTTTTTTTTQKTTTSTVTSSTTRYQGQKKNDSVETQEDDDDDDNGDDNDDEKDSSQTEQSLDAFLAMLEETRNIIPSTSERNRKREEPKVSAASHFAPQSTVPLSSSSSSSQQPNGGLLLTISPQQHQQQQWSSQPRNPYEGWAVYDDLDTEESNQTAVIASDDQKFGYVVNGNNYKRFRVEEKSSNGLITGLFGFHHNNGNIRGVQYTADPSISPKFLYDTLVKFVSS